MHFQKELGLYAIPTLTELEQKGISGNGITNSVVLYYRA